MRWVGFSSFVLVLLTSFTAPASATPTKHWYPQDVWQGYDPEALPLDFENVRAWEENGATLQ